MATSAHRPDIVRFGNTSTFRSIALTVPRDIPRAARNVTLWIKRTVDVLLLSLWLSPLLACAAGVYKCTDDHGAVTFQQTPCPSASKEVIPKISAPPTLTPEDEFRAAAYRDGNTPREAGAHLPVAHGASSASVPGDSRATVVPCANPDGTPCGILPRRRPEIMNREGEPQDGAVMMTPTTAFNPNTGRAFEVYLPEPSKSRKVVDQGEPTSSKEACRQAKIKADEARNNINLSMNRRRELDDAAYQLCMAGRKPIR